MQLGGQRAAVIVSGQNIDRAWLQTVLTGSTPRVYCERKPESDLRFPPQNLLLQAASLSVVPERPQSLLPRSSSEAAIVRMTGEGINGQTTKGRFDQTS